MRAAQDDDPAARTRIEILSGSDVWWGIAEANGPKQYNFSAWEHLAILSRDAGLVRVTRAHPVSPWHTASTSCHVPLRAVQSLQVVMSFHKCGMFGDLCDIPLPAWVRAVPDIWCERMSALPLLPPAPHLRARRQVQGP